MLKKEPKSIYQMKNDNLLVIIIAISVFFFMNNRINKLRNENERFNANQEVLLDSVEYFKIRDSINVAKVNRLSLSVTEFKKHKQEDKKLIDDLKIKASQLENVISINVKTIANLKAALKDTLIHDTITNVIDTLRYFDYKSKFTDVYGLIGNDSVQIKIENREQLKAIMYMQKKKFWFMKLPIWLFGYKTKSLDVISLNPNTVINGVEYIEIVH